MKPTIKMNNQVKLQNNRYYYDWREETRNEKDSSINKNSKNKKHKQ